MAKKDFGRRLIPEYLLKYSEDLHKNHPDPSASWGGGSGGSYTGGDGIDISSENVISVDNTIAKKDEIPTNYVTLDTEQTITGLKTIGETSGTISEVDFSGFTFKLSNKAINHPEADIKIRNGSYDGYQHPIVSSTKGLYVNLAKIRLGDDGSNTYGITMPDSSTWESDKVLATIDDIPTKTSELTNDSGFITGVTWNDVTEKPTFATVATSGSYNDLTDKPTIPTRTESPFLGVMQNSDGNVLFSETGTRSEFYKIVEVTGPTYVNLHALNPKFGTGLTSSYDSTHGELNVSIDTTTVALKSDIPSIPSTDNFVTTDTAQTITGLKTIGETSGATSEVGFSSPIFKLVNKAINNPEADIKICSGSSDEYQHPIIYSSKGVYVNLAKIKLGDNGNNTYGITMPDSSTWGADRVLATTADIPTVPTVNDSTITFTQGGVAKGSFSLNQATNQTIELDAGGAQAPAFEITNMVVDSSAQTITLTITQNN